MKHTRLTALILAGVTVFSAATLTSCKKNPASTPDNPFEQVGDSLQPNGDNNNPSSGNNNSLNGNNNSSNGNNDPSGGGYFSGEFADWFGNPNTWSENDPRGKKALYGGKMGLISPYARTGDLYVSDSNGMTYFSLDDPNVAEYLCFDPLCKHLPGDESCAAIVNSAFTDQYEKGWPKHMFFDNYDNADSPVLYLSYRRSDIFVVNMVGYQRDSVYCIERYDISKGRREIVLDKLDYTIAQMCTYGDYIYYVADMGDREDPMICRLYKGGGSPEPLVRDDMTTSLLIVDVIDDQLYYLADSRYIYRCNLDFSDSEMVLDFGQLKGKDGKRGIAAGSFSGYFYYFADVETVYAKQGKQGPTEEKCNLYRIPMSDLTETPELVAEDLFYSPDQYCFTEETLYYEPCVFEWIDEIHDDWMTNTYISVNYSDGKLYAMDLKTAESKLIIEDSGISMNLRFAWGDIVLFSGYAYKESGLEYSDNAKNLIIAYASGEPYKVLCIQGALGYVRE